MTAKIFRNSMAVGISVFLLSVALFMGVLYQYFGNQLTEELETEAWLVAKGVETMGMDYLDGLKSSSRITWIDQDGTVLYDSVADPATMKNHADREEIQEAMLGTQGTARRESATLSEKTFYVARRLEDGTVIRLASAQYTVVVLLLSMVQPLLIILVVTLILAAVLASRLSKRMIQPILALDLEHPENCDTYDELAPLLTRIRRQNDTIGRQMELMGQRRQEFEALTENMSEGFVLLDQKGHILSYNTGTLRLLGVLPPAEEANVLALDRTDAFRKSVEQVLQGVRNQCRLDRGGRCVQLLADPVFRDNQVAGAVLVLVDVTEREQGEKMRREFTANVSHELKTPLTAISGMAEIISNGMVKPEDVPGFAGDIYKESQRLIALVEDIIHLSRLDEGGTDLRREQVDLLEVARKTVQRLQPLAKQAGVTLAVAGASLVMQGVPSVLEEMVYNLCDNAVKYNHKGGTVTLSVVPGESGGEVTVADNGIGIPAEDQERVFERFYRVDKSHSKEIGGTGLGLSIVKHGAALHDARVELKSTLGEGTTVRLIFP
ncbi:ATP-binding protein [Flavonifractor sp. An100]|uniref:sensor histidine kinase n=1 Tax=Flavonifractor sp. An100 TaxID=1965538 RepID=UPI000B3B08F0|nr:ATP-binding protein [Flavonifractor sp. An100]OUQ82321.1 histidine kinase [Flavonifractor sp. An100]